MRYQIRRELDALGYRYLETLRFSGLNCHRILREQNELLCFPKALGPSWPVLLKQLRAVEPNSQPLTLAATRVVLTQDTEAVRDCLSRIASQVRESRSTEIYIQDVGFARSDLRKRNWIKVIAVPATVLMTTIAIALSPDEAAVVDEPLCLMDLSQSRIEQELSQIIASGELTSSPVKRLGESEVVSIELISSLGSVAVVEVSIRCQDERGQFSRYRVDLSGSGSLLQLP